MASTGQASASSDRLEDEFDPESGTIASSSSSDGSRVATPIANGQHAKRSMADQGNVDASRGVNSSPVPSVMLSPPPSSSAAAFSSPAPPKQLFSPPLQGVAGPPRPGMPRNAQAGPSTLGIGARPPPRPQPGPMDGVAMRPFPPGRPPMDTMRPRPPVRPMDGVPPLPMGRPLDASAVRPGPPSRPSDAGISRPMPPLARPMNAAMTRSMTPPGPPSDTSRERSTSKGRPPPQSSSPRLHPPGRPPDGLAGRVMPPQGISYGIGGLRPLRPPSHRASGSVQTLPSQLAQRAFSPPARDGQRPAFRPSPQHMRTISQEGGVNPEIAPLRHQLSHQQLAITHLANEKRFLEGRMRELLAKNQSLEAHCERVETDWLQQQQEMGEELQRRDAEAREKDTKHQSALQDLEQKLDTAIGTDSDTQDSRPLLEGLREALQKTRAEVEERDRQHAEQMAEMRTKLETSIAETKKEESNGVQSRSSPVIGSNGKLADNTGEVTAGKLAELESLLAEARAQRDKAFADLSEQRSLSKGDGIANDAAGVANGASGGDLPDRIATAEQDAATAHQRAETLQNETADMRDEARALQTRLDASREQENKISMALQATLTKSDTQTSQADVRSLEKVITELRAQVEALQRENARLVGSRRDAAPAPQTKSASHNGTSEPQEVAALRQKLEDATNEQVEKDETIKELEQRIKKVESSVISERNKAKVNLAQHVRKLREKETAHADAVAAYEDKIGRLQVGQAAGPSSEQSHSPELERVRAELEEVKKQRQSAQDAHKAAEEQMLSSQDEKTAELQRDLEAARAELEELQSRSAAQRDESEKSQTALRQSHESALAKMAQDVESSRQKHLSAIRGLDAKHDEALKRKEEAIRESQEAVDAHSAEIDALKRGLRESHELHLAALTEKDRLSETASAQHADTLAQLAEEREAQEAERRQAVERLQSLLSSTQEEHKQAMSTLQSKLKDSEEAHEKLQTEKLEAEEAKAEEHERNLKALRKEHDEALQVLQAARADLESRLQEESRKKAEIEAAQQAAVARLDRKTAEHGHLSSRLSEAYKERDTLRKRHADLEESSRRERANLQASLETNRRSLIDMEQKHAAMSDAHEELVESARVKEAEHASLLSSLQDELSAQSTASQGKISELEAKLQEITEERDENTSKLESRLRSLQNVSSRERAKSKEALEKLQAEMRAKEVAHVKAHAAAEEQIARLQEENAQAAEDAAARISDVQTQLADKQRLLEEHVAQIAQVNDTLYELRTAHNSLDAALQEKTREAAEQQRSLQAALQDWYDKHSKLEATSQSERESYEARIKELSESVASLEADKTEADARITELLLQHQDAKDAHNKTSNELQRLVVVHRNLSAAHKTAQEQLMQAQQQHETALQEAAHDLSVRTSDYETQLEEWRERLAVAEQNKAQAESDFEDEVQRLKSERSALQDEIDARDRKNAELAASLQSKEDELAAVNDTYTRLVDASKERQTEAAKVKEQHASDVANLRKQLAKAQAEHGEKQTSLQRQVELQRWDVAEARKQLQQREAELKTDNETLQKEVAELEARVRRLQVEAHEQIEKARTAAKSTQERFEKQAEILQRETDALRAERDEARDEATATDLLLQEARNSGPNVDNVSLFDRSYVDNLAQQHELDISRVRSQVRSLETRLYEEQAKASRQMRRISELEDELAAAGRRLTSPSSSTYDNNSSMTSSFSRGNNGVARFSVGAKQQAAARPIRASGQLPTMNLSIDEDDTSTNGGYADVSGTDIDSQAATPTIGSPATSPPPSLQTPYSPTSSRQGHHRRNTTNTAAQFDVLSTMRGTGNIAAGMNQSHAVSGAMPADRRAALLRKANAAALARRKAGKSTAASTDGSQGESDGRSVADTRNASQLKFDDVSVD